MEANTEHRSALIKNLTSHNTAIVGRKYSGADGKISLSIPSNTWKGGLEGVQGYPHRCCGVTLEMAEPAQGARGAWRADASAAVARRRRCWSSLAIREAMVGRVFRLLGGGGGGRDGGGEGGRERDSGRVLLGALIL